MIPLDIEKEKEGLLHHIKESLSNIKILIPDQIAGLPEALKVLQSIRNREYENINQLQHRAAIIEGALYLEKKYKTKLTWKWNPAQTGGFNEPDLFGEAGTIIVNSEVTTSENPDGIIDTRMRSVLAKLSGFSGDKYYFVKTSKMEKRANTKVDRNDFDIEVVNLTCV